MRQNFSRIRARKYSLSFLEDCSNMRCFDKFCLMGC